jgi:hypothetical protein
MGDIRTHVEAWAQLAHGALAQDVDGRLWTCERDAKSLTLTPCDDREGQPGCMITALGLYVQNDEPRWPIHHVKVTWATDEPAPAQVTVTAQYAPPVHVRILTEYRDRHAIRPLNETAIAENLRTIRLSVAEDIINALRDAGAWPDVV